MTGKDVGTPIIHFEPPHGVAFFGPVISKLPSEDQAGVLWDHVVGLARFPGFAELKRSLRERPQLPVSWASTPIRAAASRHTSTSCVMSDRRRKPSAATGSYHSLSRVMGRS